MAQIIMGHGVSGCFGTRLAPIEEVALAFCSLPTITSR